MHFICVMNCANLLYSVIAKLVIEKKDILSSCT